MKPILRLFTVLLILPACFSQAKTIGRFLDNTVLVTLSSSETDSLKAFVAEQLNNSADSKKSKWKSSESKTVGLFKTVVSFNYDGKTCRRGLIALINGAGQKDFWRFDFCKYDGQWKYTPTPLFTLEKGDKDSLLEKAHFMLEHGVKKKPVSWQSQNQSVSGALVLLDDAKQCREIALSLTAASGADMNGVYRFCLQNDQWEYDGPAL